MNLTQIDLADMQAVDEAFTQLTNDGAVVVKKATVELASGTFVKVTYDNNSCEFVFGVNE